MTKKQVAELLAEVDAQDAALRREGVVQFDGSLAWESLNKLMAEESMALARRLKQAGEAGPPCLPDHFGTPEN